jgi:hypothetical protein
MRGNDDMAGLIIFITVSTFATLLCIVTTTVCITEHAKQKRASREEIAHLKTEIRACRELLKRRAKSDV